MFRRIYFDSTGTTSDWWTSADAASFNTRTKELIELYNGFSPTEGVRLNGTRTLAENMSDLGGVLISLDAFKRKEQFKQGVSVNSFTPLQSFFLVFARRQSPQPPRLIAAMAQFGEHSPEWKRVNGVLMNIPELSEAFNIKPGDRIIFLKVNRRRSGDKLPLNRKKASAMPRLLYIMRGDWHTVRHRHIRNCRPLRGLRGADMAPFPGLTPGAIF